MVKATFTMDEETFGYLKRTAERLRIPQSRVVREAVRSFAEHSATLSEEERRVKLKIMDTVLARRSSSSLRQVESELAAVRQARRQQGRLHRSD